MLRFGKFDMIYPSPVLPMHKIYIFYYCFRPSIDRDVFILGRLFLSCMHYYTLFVLHLGITRNAGKIRKLYFQIPTLFYARESAGDCSSRIHAYKCTCPTSISQEFHAPDQDVHAWGRSWRSPSYKRRYPASCLLFILRECASSLLFKIYER